MIHDDSQARAGGATHGRWARWAPRLMAVVLAADCTGGAPPKPKADVAQAALAVAALPLAGAAARIQRTAPGLTSAS